MRKILIFFVIPVFALYSCTINSEKITEPSAEEIEKIAPIGTAISKELVQTLQKELKTAIKEGGLENAINVCNLKAVSLTEIVGKNTDQDVDIKRTTFKYRNKLNSPNDAETEALKYFENLVSEKKQFPEYYIQKVNSKNETCFYYYKPMNVGKICLTCHGDQKNISEDVLAQINKLYPEDKATGYEEGDFRGLIRIKISE